MHCIVVKYKRKQHEHTKNHYMSVEHVGPFGDLSKAYAYARTWESKQTTPAFAVVEKVFLPR